MPTPRSFVGIEPMTYQVTLFDPFNRVESKWQTNDYWAACRGAAKDLAAMPKGSAAVVCSPHEKPFNIFTFVDPEHA